MSASFHERRSALSYERFMMRARSVIHSNINELMKTPHSCQSRRQIHELVRLHPTTPETIRAFLKVFDHDVRYAFIVCDRILCTYTPQPHRPLSCVPQRVCTVSHDTCVRVFSIAELWMIIFSDPLTLEARRSFSCACKWAHAADRYAWMLQPSVTLIPSALIRWHDLQYIALNPQIEVHAGGEVLNELRGTHMLSNPYLVACACIRHLRYEKGAIYGVDVHRISRQPAPTDPRTFSRYVDPRAAIAVISALQHVVPRTGKATRVTASEILYSRFGNLRVARFALDALCGAYLTTTILS